MKFAEIMQAIGACRADDCDKCLLNGGPIAGWFPEDVPDCYTVLLKNAGEKLLEYYQKIRENDAAEENQRKTEENRTEHKTTEQHQNLTIRSGTTYNNK